MNRVLRKIIQVRLNDEQREAQFRRIMLVETNIMMPVKVVAILSAMYFYRNVVSGGVVGPHSEATVAYIAQLSSYGAGNIIFWLLLLGARLGKPWPRLLRFSGFWLALLDNLFLSGLIYFTGGLESPLYWLFIGLMIRSAVNFPIFWQQIVLNLGSCLFYTLAVVLSEEGWGMVTEELYWLRLSVLVLLGACCWGVYLLVERDRTRSQSQQEFQLREQSAAASGRLAAEMAHQLKNPLGIINNAAFLLQHRHANGQELISENINLIRKEVSRCDKILTHLMDYARLSEGKIESVDLNAAVERALKQVALAGNGVPIELHRRLTPELPPLLAQRAQIEECFLNLIQNALDAMPNGGKLTIESRYAGDGNVVFTFADTGPGIPAQEVDKIFEAFYTTKEGGTGLGLAIVKHVIESYQGRVKVHSTPGAGTRFEVLLPVRVPRTK